MKPFRISVRALIVSALIAIPLLLVYPYLLKKLGYFLIFEQEPQRVDLIVVLNGRDTERSLAAVDLYNQGYSNLIVITRKAKEPGSDEFWKRVGNHFDGRIFFQRAIEAMGVPKDSFMMIEGEVTSTYDEALAVKKFLKRNGYKSMILVTSKWHSRRAYLTFKSVLEKDHVTITIYPTKYDTFDSRTWWKIGIDAKSVFSEYGKLLYYILALRVNPFA